VLDGIGHLKNDYEEIDLLPGNIYLIPMHTTYDYYCNSNLTKFYLHFKSELFPGNDIFSTVTSCMSLPFETSLMSTLIAKADSKNISDIAWCKALFLEVIYSFNKSQISDINSQVNALSKYQNIFNYLKSNSPAKVTINQLASQMNMSVSCLSKAFKIDTGTTLKGYIKNHILQAAKEILLLENSSIKQVAYRLGFTDEFYFSRLFKKEIGLSPRDYRYNNRMDYKSSAAEIG